MANKQRGTTTNGIVEISRGAQAFHLSQTGVKQAGGSKLFMQIYRDAFPVFTSKRMIRRGCVLGRVQTL